MVNISHGRARSLSEAAGHEHWLRLWKCGGRTKGLAEVEGVVFNSKDEDTERCRRQWRRFRTTIEEMWDDGDGVFGEIARSRWQIIMIKEKRTDEYNGGRDTR